MYCDDVPGIHRRRMGVRLAAMAASVLVTAACSGGGESADTMADTGSAAASPVAVSITMPSTGDTISGTEVHVMLSATGIEIAPAAEMREGTAHHHLYLDTDLGAPDAVIPAGMENIIHLGQGQSDYHWTGLTAGEHRIIAVLADPMHVPIQPQVTDTVTFVVVP
ncbi:MAG TPA: DUF4399 domain-containing protein [Gemmatimonadaceae bacterium]